MALFKKILVIQTAFLGDVVLATAILEKLHSHFPQAQIDFLLRKGNEGLVQGHPFVHTLWVWDKNQAKYSNLLKLVRQVRQEQYDMVVNVHRHFSTGLLMALSGARTRVCFDKNPLSILATHQVPHRLGNNCSGISEVQRNLDLIGKWTDNQFVKPKIYPSNADFEKVYFEKKYITVSPASVWFTKQYPKEKWLELLDRVGESTTAFLIGGPGDAALCEWLQSNSKHPNVEVKAGRYTLLESAALMKNAAMNFVNDSGPLHLASALDAPVTAVFCSTVPAFGFGPLSTDSAVLETTEHLSCRPCGLHGKKVCPEGHFRCSKIDVERLLDRLPA